MHGDVTIYKAFLLRARKYRTLYLIRRHFSVYTYTVSSREVLSPIAYVTLIVCATVGTFIASKEVTAFLS